ncbi:MAG: hypothetical protein OJF52_000837 [Nitrospira sp.]|nr:MAG: hypothetical protein OJF52_000837 [Nitrospira sp.]
MFIQSVHLRKMIFVVLLSGILIGVAGMGEPTFSATDPIPSTDQESPAVTPDSPGGPGKGRPGRGNHPMRKACAEDVKKLCPDVKAGKGRIAQCLKQHAQELSQGCADMVQQRGKSGH